MFLKKRGMADAQFHWLFVILAGGFIFFFFAFFINQAIVANQQKQTALMLQYFDGVLSSSKNVQNLNDPIESTPSVTIEQRCDIGGQSKLVFIDQELDKRTTFLPIFSNRRISGSAYALKTLPHDAPFRVDNPIFLTDTSTLYIVIDEDENVRDKYVELLPSFAVVVAYESLDQVTESGFRDVVIVTQDSDLPLNLDGVLNPSLLSANIRWAKVSLSQNKVYYSYKFKSDDGVILVSLNELLGDSLVESYVSYSSESLLLGAIMAEDPDLYLCNKAKLDARARVIAMQIYVRAGTIVENSPDLDGSCVAVYNDVRATISGALLLDTLGELDTQDDISTENDILVRYSCPSLY